MPVFHSLDNIIFNKILEYDRSEKASLDYISSSSHSKWSAASYAENVLIFKPKHLPFFDAIINGIIVMFPIPVDIYIKKGTKF